MRPVQILLLVLFGAGLVLYFTKLRSKLSDRIITVLIVLLGSVMVVVPESTTAIAHKLGVGRGVDLVFYMFLVGLSFLALLIQSHLRALDARMAEVVRAIAILDAHTPKDDAGRRPSGSGF